MSKDMNGEVNASSVYPDYIILGLKKGGAMSQWTHVLGIIRYDAVAANVWPKPKNQQEILQNWQKKIYNIYNKNLPEGSEGPIEMTVFTTDRGPTVVITGDLRDFGKNDINKIQTWLDSSNKEVLEGYTLTKGFEGMINYRDGFVACSVEFDQRYILEPKDWEL